MTARKSLTYVEVDVPEFGDTASPIAEDTYRFAKQADYLPRDIEAIPSIVDVSFTSPRISLGENLGERATLEISFKDHRHILAAEDFDSGTFWGKWRARYGLKLRGRSIRWILGILGEDLVDMDTRHFVIEATDGPTQSGKYSIVAKDVLKLADSDRAQAPTLSNGFLVSDITDIATTATLSPSGIGDAEYPSSGYVCIGGNEVCYFTRSGNVLTFQEGSPPTSTRGDLGTTAQSHSSGDRVQVVLRYSGADPADIIYDLLTTYAGVPTAYIPLTTWQTETDSYLQRLYTTTITEPVGVRDLISELIEQAALAMWWDPLEQLIRLQVLRSISTSAATFTESDILEGTLQVSEQPDTRVSQVWTYFGPRDPTKPLDEKDNYRSVAVTADLEAETDYGGQAIRKIFSRWIPFGGLSVAERLNDIILGRFKDPPRKFSFETYRFGASIPALGGGYQLEATPIQTITGAADSAPIQVTRLTPMADRYRVEAEEMLFESIDPADLVNRTIIIDSSTNDVNLRTLHDSIYPAPTGVESPAITVTCYIEENVIVGSTDSASPAFDVGSWPGSIVVTVYVRGRIQGKGGDGGGASKTSGEMNPGENGGTALYTRYAIDLILNEGSGEIWGGGGGGAGGRIKDSSKQAGSGGGGAGQVPGSGGPEGNGDNPIHIGEDGTTEVGGAGGSPTTSEAQSGGDGGDPAVAGEDRGGGSFGVIVPGGGPGDAIDGVSYITKTGAGDIVGDEVN